MKRFFLCLYFLSFTALISYAQISATGCLVSGENKVYPNSALKVLSDGSAAYTDASPKSLDLGYCSWAPTYTAPCTVCTGLPVCALGICLCVSTSPIKYGNVGTYTMVLCNLDDYSWTLGAAAGIFGIFVIRRRNRP